MGRLENWIKLSFRSNQKFCELSVLVLNTIKSLLCIDDDEFFKIEISLREALTNAIVHGNRGDLNKLVTIEFHWERDWLRIHVRDQHMQKTDFREIEKRFHNAEVLRVSGRGIMIMKNYMDSVVFQSVSDGNEVIMEKRLRSQ